MAPPQTTWGWELDNPAWVWSWRTLELAIFLLLVSIRSEWEVADPNRNLANYRG